MPPRTKLGVISVRAWGTQQGIPKNDFFRFYIVEYNKMYISGDIICSDDYFFNTL